MSKVRNGLVPMVVDQTQNGERSYDIYSRLLKDRIVFFHDEVNQASVSLAIAQLLFLEAEDPEADIYMYINSPGGSVLDGLALVDTMNYIKPDVVTIGMGMCASMGSILISQGAKGKRFMLPNAEIMIHQVMSGAQGQVSDMEIATAHAKRLKEKLIKMLADSTDGKTSLKKMAKMSDRDTWLTAEESVEIGLIDKVIDNVNEAK